MSPIENGQKLICRVTNHQLPGSTWEDSIQLNIIRKCLVHMFLDTVQLETVLSIRLLYTEIYVVEQALFLRSSMCADSSECPLHTRICLLESQWGAKLSSKNRTKEVGVCQMCISKIKTRLNTGDYGDRSTQRENVAPVRFCLRGR